MAAGGVSEPKNARGGEGLLSATTRRCEIWGVLNVTPDSFSDGGVFYDPRAAIERVNRLLEQGADVLDIGGESSRPKGQTYGDGAEAVPVFEELRRVLPAIQHAAARGAKVSIDTVKPEVARQALSAGARIVNDVSCATNPELLQVVAEAGAELVIMHTRGRGERSGDNVRYGDVIAEVSAELAQAVERAVAMGVPRQDIWLDPGIGFAKTSTQSASLIAGAADLVALGHRVLMGPSRKSFIAELAPRADGRAPEPGDRLAGTLATVLLSVLGGCHAVRVHDVAETHQALAVLNACVRRRP